jgi:hypothetical protein
VVQHVDTQTLQLIADDPNDVQRFCALAELRSEGTALLINRLLQQSIFVISCQPETKWSLLGLCRSSIDHNLEACDKVSAVTITIPVSLWKVIVQFCNN